jgi:adenosylmethionine-8-amino-7-oxononanoate aminotransferase
MESSWIKKDLAFVWHPFTQQGFSPPPIPIVKGKGVYLYDEKGNRFLDAISSWWVNLHGHAHPYIVSQLKEQAETLEHVIFAGFTHPAAIDLAERLLYLLPGKMSKIFYSDNGSTAVEVALKMALQYWVNLKQAKLKVICFKGGYHGDTFGAMSSAGKNSWNKPFWPFLFSVAEIEPPFPGQEKISLSQLRVLLKEGNAACFIFEPLVLGAGGMRIYPPNGLNLLLKECRKERVLTIADECMTGFGRVGSLFACEALEESPDLICLSKGLTGGFLPLGATACTEEIYRAFLGSDLSRAFLHGHSYTGNPLGCRCAMASLDLLLEKGSKKARQFIAASHLKFVEKWKSHPKLKRCESLGTLLVLEYNVEDPSYFSSIKEHLSRFFMEKKILLRPLGNVVYVLPPYCIKPSALQMVYDTLTESLNIL